MAKARGHRANKPNDSFGTTNNPGLYRNKYQEDVHKDDDEEQVEAAEEQEEEQQEAQSSEPESFAKEAKPETDYKKRYDDLKRHYDEKLADWKQERDQLINQVNHNRSSKAASDTGDLDDFKNQYPEVYDAIHKISSSQSEAKVKNLEEELNTIKEREAALEKERAYQELLRLQPDFDTLKEDEKFNAWLEEQPSSISDGIYKNNTDAKWASRVVDLYKADIGVSKSKPKKSNKVSDAAMSVGRTVAKDVAVNGDGNKRTWKASEIAKLKPWEFEKLEEELDIARAEGRIDFRN